MVRMVNEEVDPDDPQDITIINNSTKKLKRKMRYHGMPSIIKAIQHAELKVGLLKLNTANRMVVDKIIRDYMMKSVKDGGLGMRQCHAVRDYNVAVSMYFLPRAQRVVLNEIDSIKVDELVEAKELLGLDGSY